MENLVGIGIYSIPEASRLTGVSNATIYRWLRGYQYQSSKGKKKIDSLWSRDIPEINGENALSFLDLLEVKFISEFRKAGVSWKFIKEAAEKAKEIFNTTHPFTTQKFRTDGRHIFSSFSERRKKKTLDLNTAMYVFEKIIEPSFYKGIEFDANQATRWFPYKKKHIVIDPQRSFGRPILKDTGIATDVIYSAFQVEGALDVVAEWYDIPISLVKSAVDFEKGLDCEAVV